LQSGVNSIFAAGDGVTGPATLIQAVGQARIAARSCHQYLMGLPVEPAKKEFLSKRDNFKVQVKEDYIEKYPKQARNEMPTLEPSERNNFSEVELGYENSEIAVTEAQRCLECGCSEYFKCDLKKYATEYDVDQKKYPGDFREYQVDFRHPYIEIDSNKCILCSRCVRICKEVVGANALGLVNRGFKTYVTPCMGLSLQDTTCESCGMCISTCPTGALSENVSFKPGPVKLDTIDTICNYCSVGCEISIHHRNSFVMQVTGKKGKINMDGNICRYPKFGYLYFNDKNRLTKPLLKTGGKYEAISFEEALNIITYKIKSVDPDQNAFFAGARLTNEEMYLVQKLARFGAKTNNVYSFHYLNRGTAYQFNSDSNAPFEQLSGASKIFLLGSEINMENAVPGFMISNLRYTKGIPVDLITTDKDNKMIHKVDNVLQVKDYYYFVKAVNHYLLSNNLQNMLYIEGNCENYNEYRKSILKEDFKFLVEKGACCEECVVRFAEDFNKQMNAILVYAEKQLNSVTCTEIMNLAMITGKLGKTSNGLISLKEKNNSHGLFDMGIAPELGTGGVSVTDECYQAKVKEKWNMKEFPRNVIHNPVESLEKGKMKNLFIFGEDPIGCAIDKKKVANWIKKADFVMVQDYFMTETAQEADLILPYSFPLVSGGSYTNTQKVIQKFEENPGFDSGIEKPAFRQLGELLEKFGAVKYEDVVDVMMEVISLLPDNQSDKYGFVYTSPSSEERMFNDGCDYLIKYFNSAF